MKDEPAPGICMLVEAINGDDEAIALVSKVEGLLSDALNRGATAVGVLAVMASALGYAIGNGHRSSGDGIDDLHSAIAMATTILEDSALDVFHNGHGDD